jgi:hypothetical protein
MKHSIGAIKLSVNWIAREENSALFQRHLHCSGLPMAILATVDGEKTSGGAAVLPLPENNGDPGEDVAGTQVTTLRSTQKQKSTPVNCAK